MNRSFLGGNLPPARHRNHSSPTVFQDLPTRTQKKARATPMQRPFALSFTVGAVLYAAVSVLTLIALHNATASGRVMNSGYGITTSGQ
jgi:hypothetical protein